jgi:hypothetical protein
MKKMFQIIATLFVVVVYVLSAYETAHMIAIDFEFEKFIIAIVVYTCILAVCVKLLEEIKNM